MKLWIETPHPAASLTVTLPKLGKPQYSMSHIMLTMEKPAAVPLAARKKIDSTVAEMHLS